MDDIKGVLNLYRGQLYVFPRAHEVSYKQYTHRCPCHGTGNACNYEHGMGWITASNQ